MSLFEQGLADAAATTAVQSGDYTFGQKVGAVAAGALYSALHSFYNTGVAAANALGASAEEASTVEWLQENDEKWAQYYKENQTAIDLVGFVGGAMLPGTAALKGLSALRSGENVGALGRALQFAPNQQRKYLAAALKELEQEGGSVFTRINRNKFGVMSWEFADQTLQATVFETAVALTMNQSPLLADDGAWDITKGIFTGALLGGGIGGTISSLGINKVFKNAVTEIDRRSAGYQAVYGVQRLDLPEGDKAFAIIDSLLSLPDTALAKDKVLELSFPLGSGPVTSKVDLTTVLTNLLGQSKNKAMNEFELSIRKIASGADAGSGGADPAAAEALAKFVLGKLEKLRIDGAQPSIIREELGDTLFQLRKVQPATDENALNPGQVIFIKKSITAEERAAALVAKDYVNIATSRFPIKDGNSAYDKGYIYTGSPVQWDKERVALIGHEGETGFPNLGAAWKAGYNIAKQQDGSLRINQHSGAWKAVDDDALAHNTPKRFLNTRTGTFTEDTVLTAADKAAKGKKLEVEGNQVLLPLKDSTQTLHMARTSVTNSAALPLDYVTARHAWAAAKGTVLPDVIDATDISLLQRLLTAPEATKANTKIKMPDGTLLSGVSVEDLLLRQKISMVQDLFTGGTRDFREVAYRLATTEDWVGRVVASEFGATPDAMRALKDGMNRDLAEFASRENVIAVYDSPYQFTEVYTPASRAMTAAEKRQAIMDQASVNGGQFVTGQLAHEYRKMRAIQAAKNAGTSILGAERAGQLIDLSQDAATLANSGGAGASLFGAANANYGDKLQLAMQHSGKLVHGWIAEASDNIANEFSTVATKLIDNPKAGAELGIVTTILRNSSERYVVDTAMPQRLIHAALADHSMPQGRYQELLARLKEQNPNIRIHIDVKEKDTWDFLMTHNRLNAARVEKENVIAASRGMQGKKSEYFYAPPVDTNYFQHFAFVRPIDGRAFSTSEVAMIFGRDAAELQKRMALVDQTQFKVITKDAGEAYRKAKGDYDFDQTISERSIDSSLHRSGALADFFPETRAENLIEDYLRWHKNKESRVIRNGVESIYAQQFEELRQLGSSFTEDATSKFSGTLRASKSEIVNPYEDYIKTALDISKRSEYTFLHQANEFLDALGTRAYRVLTDVTGKAAKGVVPWEEANRIANNHGLGNLYNPENYLPINAPRDRNLIKEYVAKANTLLANVVLRLDYVQPLMNIISTPLLLGTELASIKTLALKDPQLIGQLTELTRVAVPGTGGAASVPSTLKLLGNAMRNFWGPEKAQLLARYKANGDVKDVLTLYHDALEGLALTPDFRKFQKGVDTATEKLMGHLTRPADFSEEFTRFVSADVMRQLTEPLVNANKLTIQEANAYISTFVNRVQGNYISSQRPIVFQGVIGAAIGLFQTYSFNLLQQLTRHIGNKDARAVATMYGMQTALFGLNGTPMFDAINTHIIGNASMNQGHYDAYSVAPGLFGKEWGDWLLYGTASAFPAFGDKWPSLYTRGDINPRHMTILPTNPLDVPAIDGSIRFISNLMDMGKKMAGGADISESLLQGLEHNGLNRPLAGIAQLLQGHSTTSKGGLIAATSDYDLISSAARIAGAKPMDEAVALNNMYRLKAYQAADRDRMTALGETVKTYLLRNEYPGDEELLKFMDRYARIGGRVENFNAALQHWSKDANVSTVEKMRAAFRTTTGQRLSEIMGGGALPDYRTTPAEEESQ